MQGGEGGVQETEQYRKTKGFRRHERTCRSD